MSEERTDNRVYSWGAGEMQVQSGGEGDPPPHDAPDEPPSDHVPAEGDPPPHGSVGGDEGYPTHYQNPDPSDSGEAGTRDGAPGDEGFGGY